VILSVLGVVLVCGLIWYEREVIGQKWNWCRQGWNWCRNKIGY
jgi:hypothetical protein